MQHGFLGATQKGQAAGAHASSPPGQQRQRLSPPAGAQSEELLDQCLELLRGPSDERRRAARRSNASLQALKAACLEHALGHRSLVVARRRPRSQRLPHPPPAACRFVGLLLVTQLLPAGDAATLGRVLEAVGPAFLDRLLLSLKSGQVCGLAAAS